MKEIKNFIEAHKLSGCGGSYRRGVVFKDDKICRMFINFTTSKMDSHNRDFSKIVYAGRGRKDNDKYFVEDTHKNRENVKMINSDNIFPVYVKLDGKYYYLGRYIIVKNEVLRRYNPNLGKYFRSISFYIIRKK